MPGNDPYKREDSQLLFGTESTQGTAATVDREVGKVEGDTELPDPEIDWQEERSIGGGSSRELTDKFAGQNSYEGGSLPITPFDGFPIALLLGSDSVQADTGLDSTGSSTGDTGTTLHTLTVNEAKKPPTVTCEATYFGRGGASDFVRTFTGMTPPSGTISTDNEGRLTTELDMVAMGVSTGTSSTSVAADGRDPWLFHDIESDLSLFGTSYARVTEFELEISANVSPRHYIQSATGKDPFEILNGNIEYELSATIVPDDDSLYSELKSRSDAGSANLQFYKSTDDERLRIELSNIGIESGGHPMPEEGAPEVDVTIIPESVTVKVEDTQATSAYV